MKKIKKFISGALLLLIALVIFKGCLSLKSNGISISSNNIKLYIETADSSSKYKAQVNWHYLAAIDAVRYKNDFSKSNKENIKKLADRFIKLNSGKYKLNTLESVLIRLQFKDDDRKKVYKYLDDLKYVGLKNKQLNNSTSHIKFINNITSEAMEIYYTYGILPSITISQAILESGWGSSKLYKDANNIFGIKADRSWDGKSVSMNTTEYNNEAQVANFRYYENKRQAFIDFARFLKTNKRYTRYGLFKTGNYIRQSEALEKSGYSTKENKNGERIYANLLIQLIRENNLQLIDSKAQMEKQ